MKRRSLALAIFVVAASAACVGREFQEPVEVVAPSPRATRIPSSPQGYYLRMDCMDANRDRRVNSVDLTPGVLVDLNLDGDLDQADANAVQEYEMDLVGRVDCTTNDPRFLITDPRGPSGDCGSDPFVVMVGIAGASEFGLDREDSAVGVRQLLSKMQTQWASFRTAIVLSSAEVLGAGLSAKNQAIEDWLVAVLGAIAAEHECAAFVIVGHSHGATVAGAVAERLEGERAGQIALVVLLDRIVARYDDETQLRQDPQRGIPARLTVLNFYQSNDRQPEKNGATVGGAMVENVDVSSYPLDRVACPGALVEQTRVFHECLDTDPQIQDQVLTTANAIIEGQRSRR